MKSDFLPKGYITEDEQAEIEEAKRQECVDYLEELKVKALDTIK